MPPDQSAVEDTLQQYEVMAAALLDAYRTGTPDAMERHWSLTWHRREWQAMRTYVQIDLGKQAATDVEITLDDARWLVAREHGFEDWGALVRDISSRPVHIGLLAKPIAPLSRDARHHADGDWGSRDWSDVLARLAQRDTTGLDANGQMTDAMMRDIARFSHVTTLSLGGSGELSDDGVRRLARMTNLRYLDLSGTGVTDAGLSALRELANLASISLAWTRVTDTGIAALSACEQLQRVNLAGTRCGDGAIRAFAGKASLRHFLSGNGVTDSGISALHDFPVYKHWQGGDYAAGELGYDRGPNGLMLRGSFTDRGLAGVRGLDGLFGLNLDDSKLAITGNGLAPLVDLANLGWLGFDAKDDAMPHIATMPKLRGLACQDSTASDSGWVALGASQSLEHIWGRRCHGLEHAGFVALSRIPTLRYLSVSCKNVDDSAIATLPQFPSLRELMPMDIPDAGYRHIGKCTQLESLVLMYCRDTTDAATAHLTAMPNLAKYFASYTQITDRTPMLLSRVESLEQVTFDSCAGLTNSGIAALARLPRLRELRVSGRGLTHDVSRGFPTSVTVHYSL